jgi:glycosyltransferase involved in cell wall biosynthesis
MLGWELPPYNSGGLGIACYQLCKALAKRNADIEFVLPYAYNYPIDFMKVTTFSQMTALEWIKKYGSVYSNIAGKGLDFIYSQEMSLDKALEWAIREQRFDIIHAHDWLTFRSALKVKQLTNWPLIVHLHSVESDRAGGHRGNPLVEEIEALGVTMADRVIAVSQYTKKAIMRDYGIPADKIEVVYNGIDESEMMPLDDASSYPYLERLIQNGYHVVTNVGRLTIQKNLTVLLRAAKEVIYRVPKTIFLLVGDGDQYNELISLSADLGIAKNVIFTGFQRGKQWRDSFALSDLFVMPSISEPFGLTPIEALFYGVPSLISRQSGVGEVYANCLKVDYWDVNEISNQITAVLQNPGLHETLVNNAVHELDHLTWDKPSQRLMNIYQKQAAGVMA